MVDLKSCPFPWILGIVRLHGLSKLINNKRIYLTKERNKLKTTSLMEGEGGVAEEGWEVIESSWYLAYSPAEL